MWLLLMCKFHSIYWLKKKVTHSKSLKKLYHFSMTSMSFFLFFSAPFLLQSYLSILDESLCSVLSLHQTSIPALLWMSMHPSSVQLHNNPGRQQDLDLTADMRRWNQMTSVVRECACLIQLYVVLVYETLIWVLLNLQVGDCVWISLYLLLCVAMNPYSYRPVCASDI